MRRILLFLLLPFSLTSSAQDITITDGDVSYYFNITSSTDHTVAVTNSTGKATNTSSNYTGVINIPEIITYEGTDYTVTSVGQSAFRSCDNLDQVILPNTIESIDTLAFYTTSSHSGPGTVNIPSSVKYIGGQAFYGCSTITGGLPDSLEYIGYRAFYKTGLEWVSIPSTVTHLGSLAFQSCTSLKYLEILHSDTPLDVSSATKDSEIPFYGCSALESVFFDRDLTIYASFTPFSRLSSIVSLQIGEHITSLPQYLVYNCTGLKEVQFDKIDNITAIGSNAFYGCSSLPAITLPPSLTRLEQALFQKCSALASIEIPDSVTFLGMSVFTDCSSLTELTIPEGVTSIGTSAFAGCTALRKLHVLHEEPVEVSFSVFGENVSGNTIVDGDSDYPLVIYVPQGSEEAYEASSWYTNVVGDSRFLGKIIFNSSVVSLDSADATEEVDFATYYHPYALTVPDSVTAYAVTAVDDEGTLTLTAVEGGIIPQHSAVLLGCPASSAGAYRIYIAEDDAHAALSDNMLYGSTQTTTTNVDGVTDGYYFYGLTTKDNANLGFYWGAEDGGAFTMPANRAWLAVPDVAASKYSYLSLRKEGDTSGISAVDTSSAADGAIYTLQGVRVSDMSQRGIYIVNGKKVLVK